MNIYNRLIGIILKSYGYDINKSLNHLRYLKALSENLFWDEQSKKRDKIIKHHISHTTWYRNFFDPDKKIDWSMIPILTKSDLQIYSSQYNHSVLHNYRYYSSNTSGSSGNPLHFIKNKYCHSLAWAKILTSYAALNISRYDKEARFFGHVKGERLTLLYENIKDIFLNRKRLDIFNLSDDNFQIMINHLIKNKFDYIYGYTNVIRELSKYILQNGLSPLKEYCSTLKSCIVTAEMCYDIDRDMIERALGIPVYIEYGCSETSIIAIDNRDKKLGISTDRIWVEIVDDNNKLLEYGNVGKIIITDLYNEIFPIIRYEIGDYGSIERSDKYPYLFLKNLVGRISDMILLPSGRKAPGLTFYYISRSIIEKSDAIKEFRIIQKSLDTFVFQIVGTQNIDYSLRKQIYIETEKYLEPGLTIKFEICDSIQNKYSDKIQHFFSEIN